VMYLCSTPYAPAIEHGVHPLDPALGIAWPSEVEPILSQKDAAAPGLDAARRAGLLPVYSDCRAFAARLRDAAAYPNRDIGLPLQAPEPSG
jgi:dTDP-4-dehydrorhamnose 3,5-epimerase